VVLLWQKVVSWLVNHHVLILVINRGRVILVSTLRLLNELSLKRATSHALLGLLLSSKSLRVIQQGVITVSVLLPGGSAGPLHMPPMQSFRCGSNDLLNLEVFLHLVDLLVVNAHPLFRELFLHYTREPFLIEAFLSNRFLSLPLPLLRAIPRSIDWVRALLQG